MNNYLIECLDNLSIDIEINKIIKEKDFNSIEKTIYDLNDNSLNQALEDLDTYGLFTNKKIIIIKNIDKITKSNLDYDFDKALNNLYKYLKNSNPDNLLIIVVNKLNNKLSMSKELKKLCEYKQIPIDSNEFIKNKLKDYSLETGFINYLIDICNNNITKIDNECNKLMNYKYDEKTLTKEDIDLLVTKEYGESTNLTFNFIQTIGEKNISKALKQFKELIEYDPNVVGLITLIDNQFRLMYQIKCLENLSDEKIAKKLNISNPYRVKKIRELTYFYTKEDIRKVIIELSNIDLKSKTTDMDPISLVEDFILKLEVII